MLLSAGLIMVSLGTAYLLYLAFRKGERFEYALALFIFEFGMLGIVPTIVPRGLGQIAVTTLVGLSMLWTWVVWRKLFREHQKAQK